MSRVEAEQCFEKIDKDHGGSIDRQEFFESYEPIWKYQVKNMLQAKQKVRAQRLAAAARTAPNRCIRSSRTLHQEHKRLESPRKGGKRP